MAWRGVAWRAVGLVQLGVYTILYCRARQRFGVPPLAGYLPPSTLFGFFVYFLFAYRKRILLIPQGSCTGTSSPRYAHQRKTNKV
jgi:hypothetical protein